MSGTTWCSACGRVLGTDKYDLPAPHTCFQDREAPKYGEELTPDGKYIKVADADGKPITPVDVTATKNK